MSNILIVTANQRLRSVLPALLARNASLVYQGSVASASEALTRAFAAAPDVVVSDLPPATTAEVMTWRAVRECGPRLVMLTRYIHEGNDLRAALAGAAGLILVPERDLVDSILRSAAGVMLRSPELDGRLRAIVSGEAPSILDASERRVLGLVAEGYSDAVIAAQLAIRPEDVREHIARIAETLN